MLRGVQRRTRIDMLDSFVRGLHELRCLSLTQEGVDVLVVRRDTGGWLRVCAAVGSGNAAKRLLSASVSAHGAAGFGAFTVKEHGHGAPVWLSKAGQAGPSAVTLPGACRHTAAGCALVEPTRITVRLHFDSPRPPLFNRRLPPSASQSPALECWMLHPNCLILKLAALQLRAVAGLLLAQFRLMAHGGGNNALTQSVPNAPKPAM